ncbi:uncharacterized protein LOC108150789 isoform X2 [Drosophila miranda]|uniref:uncharacterized protein LOC108150789 isoform X2 n=1 Tax=Drosophila miranda TaxID=7229 RepID=UPI00143F64A1|nr:uncharacterized protein LOC108150789 isoform X2 [Drosophila miranda]
MGIKAVAFLSQISSITSFGLNMFNKTILVALILCACYLSAIQARPQLDVAQPVIAGVAQGATGGALTQPITGLTKIATGGAGGGLPGLPSLPGVPALG